MKKRNQLFRLLLLLSIGALLLVACGSGDASDAEVVEILTGDSEQIEDTSGSDVVGDDQEEGGDMTEGESVEGGEGSEDVDEPAAPPPEPKTGLEATDPTTVVLASGSPQLVEFFAFW